MWFFRHCFNCPILFKVSVNSSALFVPINIFLDALYIHLSEGDVEKTEEIKPGMMLDYDAEGNVLGVEVLYVSKRADIPLKKAA